MKKEFYVPKKFYAKEENGKGLIFCNDFIQGKYPCFVEINYETASKQVEKLNKEEQEKLIFEQIFVALKFGILKA